MRIILVAVIVLLAAPAVAQDDVVLGQRPLPPGSVARLPVTLSTNAPDAIVSFVVPSITHTTQSDNIVEGSPQTFDALPDSRDHLSYSWHVESQGDHKVLGSATMSRFTFVPEDRRDYTVVLRVGRRDRPEVALSEQRYVMHVTRREGRGGWGWFWTVVTFGWVR